MVNGQVITQNIVTTPSWDTIVADEVGALTLPAPVTTFKTPLLYNRVRFQWHTLWTPNSNGSRYSFLEQNGNVLIEDAVQNGSNLNDVSRMKFSPWFVTVFGDQWILQVKQDQVNLTFSPAGSGSQQAWLQAEWGMAP